MCRALDSLRKALPKAYTLICVCGGGGGEVGAPPHNTVACLPAVHHWSLARDLSTTVSQRQTNRHILMQITELDEVMCYYGYVVFPHSYRLDKDKQYRQCWTFVLWSGSIAVPSWRTWRQCLYSAGWDAVVDRGLLFSSLLESIITWVQPVTK